MLTAAKSVGPCAESALCGFLPWRQSRRESRVWPALLPRMHPYGRHAFTPVQVARLALDLDRRQAFGRTSLCKCLRIKGSCLRRAARSCSRCLRRMKLYPPRLVRHCLKRDDAVQAGFKLLKERDLRKRLQCWRRGRGRGCRPQASSVWERGFAAMSSVRQAEANGTNAVR
jgi:hypothetical protein